MSKNFDKRAFLQWISEKFEDKLPYEWHYELIANIIEYGLSQYLDIDKFAIYVSNMIPDITIEDVIKFCS